MIIELKPCTGCKKLSRDNQLKKFKFRKGKNYIAVCESCFTNFSLLDEVLKNISFKTRHDD